MRARLPAELPAKRRRAAISGVVVALGIMLGCQAAAPLPAVTHVDLPRYMGDWYVLASIPTFMERHAYNAVESYTLTGEGKIRTTFRFRNGSPNGPVKVLHALGTVRPHTGAAIWGMQFIWPIKAEYRIVYLDDEYLTVIVGRSKRDYLWVMARTPDISEAHYARLMQQVASMGYDVGTVRRVPQKWPDS